MHLKHNFSGSEFSFMGKGCSRVGNHHVFVCIAFLMLFYYLLQLVEKSYNFGEDGYWF